MMSETNSDTGAADAIGVVAGTHRGPWVQPHVGGNEGNVEDVRSTRSEAEDGAGEGSKGAAIALATRSVGGVGVSGTSGEEAAGVGDKGIGGP